MTVLALGKNDHRYIVKLAYTPEGQRAIESETNALSSLEGCEFSDSAPRIVFSGLEWNGYHVHAQSTVPYGGTKQIGTLTKAHFAFLAKLSKMNRSVMTAGDCLRSHAVISSAVEKSLFKTRPILCHRTHGDFAPWNIRCKEDTFYAYDWEDSDPCGVAFTDICHFIYRQSMLVGPKLSAKKMYNKMVQACDQLAVLAEYPTFDHNAARLLWMMKEYANRPAPILAELMDLNMESVKQ